MTRPRFFSPVIAHRGASAYAPENTLSSFKKAHELKSKWVEFDVMVSPKDMNPVAFIFHDFTLDRTTTQIGNVADFSYAQLREFDAGSRFDDNFKGEHIPTLKEVLEYLAENDMSANVEIKPLPDEDERTAAEALRVVNEIFPQPSSNILFSSFSVIALKYIHDHAPESYLGLLINHWLPDWEKIAADLNCFSINVDEKILTKEDAKKIKRMDKQLLCYTVDNPVRAAELFSWGVDAVFSNAPDKINSLSLFNQNKDRIYEVDTTQTRLVDGAPSCSSL